MNQKPLLTSGRSCASLTGEAGDPPPPTGAHSARPAGSGRPAGWIGWLLGREQRGPRGEPRAHDSVNLLFALQLDQTAPVWLEARGTSMLPWRMPRSELRLEPAGSELEVGTIVVFHRGRELYYHRVIQRISQNLWQTKGDTLLLADEPIAPDSILGRVTAVRRGNHLRDVHPDRGAAILSSRLGGGFGRLTRSLGPRLRFGLRVVYLAVLLLAWPFRGFLGLRASRSGPAGPVPVRFLPKD